MRLTGHGNSGGHRPEISTRNCKAAVSPSERPRGFVLKQASCGISPFLHMRQVSSGRLFDRFLLVRRKLRLQLVGNGLGDLALNGEDIGKIAIVGLGPEMRIIASVD